jgi:hypothetical protein
VRACARQTPTVSAVGGVLLLANSRDEAVEALRDG